ncbi:recombinase [Salmonella enterica subsp. enterica serovar Typhi]|nr:recombinase [Salmonella enterica subsp. enterica serovar Typhi]
MALTDIKVRTTKPSDKPFKLTDGQGMHLLINPNGSKYWQLQYRFGGKLIDPTRVIGIQP